MCDTYTTKLLDCTLLSSPHGKRFIIVISALTSDARKSSNLHQAYRDEVHKAVKNRTSKDEDYTPDRFPSTKDYIEKS